MLVKTIIYNFYLKKLNYLSPWNVFGKENIIVSNNDNSDVIRLG